MELDRMKVVLPPNDSHEALLSRWFEARRISPENVTAARALAQTLADDDGYGAGAWFARLAWLGTFLGALCLGAGIIFFFAYNWADLHHLAKFALLQGAIAANLFCLYLLDKANQVYGRYGALLLLDLLVGALLALVGQVYQTGADPWQLFALWSLFSLVLATAYQSDMLWCGFIAQLNIAVWLYFKTFPGIWALFDSTQEMCLLLAVINLSLHLLLDVGIRARQGWAKQPFANHVCLILALAALMWLAAEQVFELSARQEGGVGRVVLGLLLLAGPVYFYYRRLHADAFGLGLWGFAAIGVSTLVLIRIIFDDNSDPVGPFMLVGLFVVGCSSAFGVYLKSMLREAGQ